MTRLADLKLIHVTDGSPQDAGDARRSGFRNREAYANARLKELDEALAVLGVVPSLRLRYGVRDQQAALVMADLAHRLAMDLADVEVVITHSYEGGHPDHDAVAFAVQAASVLLARAGHVPPRRWEFAGYHKAADGRLRAGRFAPGRFAPEYGLALSPADELRRARALAAFRSQQGALAALGAREERVRRAPLYDFASPPPTGAALYDDWGWSLTAAVWRERARAALKELGL
jgi:LmbE family N-acetylglucosaminyl deacetylase